MTDTTAKAIIGLVKPIAKRMEHLSVESRITLLCGLLAQEICNLPMGDREDELERVLDEMPSILRATERGMREALVGNARRGL